MGSLEKCDASDERFYLSVDHLNIDILDIGYWIWDASYDMFQMGCDHDEPAS